MKRATYNKVDATTRYLAYVPLPATYCAIFLADSFWVAAGIFLASFLPYLIGYNLIVRGWLYRKIED